MARIIIGLLFLGLAACVTAEGTAYGPADAAGYGYSEIKIEKDRYRIVFSGDGATPPGVVEAFALRRAAELARADGYDWFRVIARDLDAEERGGVGLGAGVGSGRYGRRGGVGVGIGGDLGTVGGRRFYTSRIEVLMGSGEKPTDDGDYYDAQSVIDAGDAFQAPRSRRLEPGETPDFKDDVDDAADVGADAGVDVGAGGEADAEAAPEGDY